MERSKIVGLQRIQEAIRNDNMERSKIVGLQRIQEANYKTMRLLTNLDVKMERPTSKLKGWVTICNQDVPFIIVNHSVDIPANEDIYTPSNILPVFGKKKRKYHSNELIQEILLIHVTPSRIYSTFITKETFKSLRVEMTSGNHNWLISDKQVDKYYMLPIHQCSILPATARPIKYLIHNNTILGQWVGEVMDLDKLPSDYMIHQGTSFYKDVYKLPSYSTIPEPRYTIHPLF